MSTEVVPPFHGDKDDENPEDFLRAFFRRMGTNSDDTRKAQFPNYLQADSVADDWFMDLSAAEKKTWSDIQTAFRTRWPRKKQVKKSQEEYEEEITTHKLKIENLGDKEKIAGREVYSHIAWADRLAIAVKGAKLERTMTYIGQIRKDLPKAIREKVGTGHTDWEVFLQAVRDVDIDHIKEAKDIWNKEQAEHQTMEKRVQKLEAVSKSPTAPIRQQLSSIALSRQPVSTHTDNDPFSTASGGQGSLRFTTSPGIQRQGRSATTNYTPRAPPTVEQKAALRALLATIPHHPDTQAGRQAHQAQQAEWMRTYGPNVKITDKTPYPLRPGTTPINSGECFTCGQIGHFGSRAGTECQALGHRPLHPNEQQWRAICSRILKEPRNATNVHLVAVDDYGTTWQDIQGNGEGPST